MSRIRSKGIKRDKTVDYLGAAGIGGSKSYDFNSSAAKAFERKVISSQLSEELMYLAQAVYRMVFVKRLKPTARMLAEELGQPESVVSDQVLSLVRKNIVAVNSIGQVLPVRERK